MTNYNEGHRGVDRGLAYLYWIYVFGACVVATSSETTD